MEKSLRVAGKNGRRRRHGQEGNQGQDRSAQERAVSGFPQTGYGELGGGPPAKRNSARHAKSPRSITLSLVRSAAERQGKGLFWNRKHSEIYFSIYIESFEETLKLQSRQSEIFKKEGKRKTRCMLLYLVFILTSRLLFMLKRHFVPQLC